MVVRAQGQGALFTVITFPVLLPVLLMNIHCTATLFGGALPAAPELAFLAAFDAAWIVGGSLLFDYLWQE
ncbi:hypothetical protein [Thermosinus carboxydivorans]|uniref:hypothetical protein n=1 Tax=Thermosinus carboxydivorans TaxID=261685 RepID=UPI00031AE4D1|nr:hypothetical protein [Thermosinus carboxydivorans]